MWLWQIRGNDNDRPGFFWGEKVREIGTAKNWEAGKQFRSPIIEAVLIDHLVAAIVAFRSRGLGVRVCVCVSGLKLTLEKVLYDRYPAAR